MKAVPVLLPALLLTACSATAPRAAVVDHTQMVYMACSQPGGVGATDVCELAVMNLDGSGFRQLTHDGRQVFLPHYSPDGTHIVYTKFIVGGYMSPDAQADVEVYDVATGSETFLTRTGGASQPTYSPDGTRIAYASSKTTPGSTVPFGLFVMNADGSDAQRIGGPSGAPDDLVWADDAWSSDNWIYFVVEQNIDGCDKVRIDKIRPDGSARTQVTDGGPNCTPMGLEQSGDADPGLSHDGQTVYSSRGFPAPPSGGATGDVERKLYAISSDAWTPGKVERDLSLPSEPSCIEGVPKGSPDGTRILLFRACFDQSGETPGIFVTDTAGSYRTRITSGFGPDWNPVAP